MKRIIHGSRPDKSSHSIILPSRNARALRTPSGAGILGCTSFDNPASHWPGDVSTPRHEERLDFEILQEKHHDKFSEARARYDMKSPAFLIAGERDQEAA